MSSRKSSASSTTSGYKFQSSSSTKPQSSSKATGQAASSSLKKVSYLKDVNEKDIKDEKALKRYHIMIEKLNEISLVKEKSKPLPAINPAANKTIIPDSSNTINKNESRDEIRSEHKAPNELLEEFLVYVMQKQWEDAHKLCKFILMYEPNNKTAKEFLPLIEHKLAESDNENDEDDDDEDDDEDDSSSDESDDDESGDDTSSDDNGSDEEKDKKLKHVKHEITTDDDDDVQISLKIAAHQK